LGEVTAVIPSAGMLDTMRMLRDQAEFQFDLLADVCGVDYLRYAERPCPPGQRFAAVYHLLSLTAQSAVASPRVCAGRRVPGDFLGRGYLADGQLVRA
jgi:NADH:ubiquinone oxidoreductase subunit C